MPKDTKNKIQGMLTSAAEIQEPQERSRKYRNIVGILAQEAVRSGDTWYLEEALKTAGLVTIDPSKAYVDIIRAMARIGTNRKDEKIPRNALKITERIDNSLDLSVALHELVVAFAKIGIDKKDEKILSYSLNLTEKVPLDTYRSSAFRNIAKLHAGANPKRALELLETAIELIEKSKGIEPVYFISAFCDIAAQLAKLNDERSYGFITRAIALADDIADVFEKSAILLKIVETEIAVGAQKHDEKLLKEASVISSGITREYYKTLALDAIKRID
ncbi:MAG: hypothetical protein O8C56_00120 [Candidatus Methanoperedens sp.]|nr:hypothetical protein [Candidatus Methanoperedens sp.]